MKKGFFTSLFSCLLALILAVTPIIPVSAATNKLYIEDLCIGYGSDGHNALIDAGYIILANQSVNRISNDKEVYIGYKMTDDYKEAITDVAVYPVSSDNPCELSLQLDMAFPTQGYNQYTIEYTGVLAVNSTEENKVLGDLYGGSRESEKLLLYVSHNSRVNSPLTNDCLVLSSENLTLIQKKQYLPIHELFTVPQEGWSSVHCIPNAHDLKAYDLVGSSGSSLYFYIKRDLTYAPGPRVNLVTGAIFDDSASLTVVIAFVVGAGLSAAVIIPVMKKKNKKAA